MFTRLSKKSESTRFGSSENCSRVLPEGLQLPIMLGFELPDARPNLISVTLVPLVRETGGFGAIVGPRC